MDKRSGGPYNRGMMDSYYGRSFRPHYYAGEPYVSSRITELTRGQVAEYRQGYEDNKAYGDHKDYG